MVGKKELERILNIIKAMLLGYTLKYKDTMICLNINMNPYRKVESIKDGVLLSSWVPFTVDTGLSFYSDIAVEITDEEYGHVLSFIKEREVLDTPIQDTLYEQEQERIQQVKSEQVKSEQVKKEQEDDTTTNREEI